MAWPTPRTPTGGAESAQRKQELGRTESGGGDLQAAALLASCPTPDTGIGPHGHRGVSSNQKHQSAKDLQAVARMASWSTPSARDHKDTSDPATWNCTEERNRYDQLPRQVQLTASGPTPNGSGAATGSTGQLNPEFSLWLQGFPIAWARCAAQVTRSSRRSPQSSSEPRLTAGSGK